jgi:hypothetical protein
MSSYPLSDTHEPFPLRYNGACVAQPTCLVESLPTELDEGEGAALFVYVEI